MRKTAGKTKAGKVSEIPSERVKKALEARDIEGLFRVLKDWPLGELQALQSDIDLFHRATMRQLDAVARAASRAIFKGKGNKAIRGAVKDAKVRANWKLMTVCSEILSVVLYYIDRKKA